MAMLDCDVARTRASHIRLMFNTLAVLTYLLHDVDAVTATTLRDPNDGDKGWTTLEVLFHLRDYDRIFLDRARLMVAEIDPPLPGYDHERLAVERRYNEQDMATVLADLRASRAAFIAFFEGLDEAHWQRAGVHPERGRFTMDDALMQVGQHDAIHLEQITRILRG